MTLDEMILKAIPVNSKCAIEEGYNKVRREALKKRFNEYLSDQLAKQFNAKPASDQLRTGVLSNTN